MRLSPRAPWQLSPGPSAPRLLSPDHPCPFLRLAPLTVGGGLESRQVLPGTWLGRPLGAGPVLLGGRHSPPPTGVSVVWGDGQRTGWLQGRRFRVPGRVGQDTAWVGWGRGAVGQAEMGGGFWTGRAACPQAAWVCRCPRNGKGVRTGQAEAAEAPVVGGGVREVTVLDPPVQPPPADGRTTSPCQDLSPSRVGLAWPWPARGWHDDPHPTSPPAGCSPGQRVS